MEWISVDDKLPALGKLGGSGSPCSQKVMLCGWFFPESDLDPRPFIEFGRLVYNGAGPESERMWWERIFDIYRHYRDMHSFHIRQKCAPFSRGTQVTHWAPCPTLPDLSGTHPDSYWDVKERFAAPDFLEIPPDWKYD